jgi:xanthosine utilization system XapX-like protein
MDEDNITVRTRWTAIWVALGAVAGFSGFAVALVFTFVKDVNAPAPAGVALWFFVGLLLALAVANMALIWAKLFHWDRLASRIIDISSHFTAYLRLGG